MSRPSTVLGQPMPVVDERGPGVLVVVLVDVDDFEVSRLAQGDHWAQEQIALVEGLLARELAVDDDGKADLSRVPPDAWVVPIRGGCADVVQARALSYAEWVRSAIAEETGLTVTVGVSGAHTGATRMESALAEAVAGIERKLLEDGNRVVCVYDTCGDDVRALPERIEHELGRCIREGDPESALKVLSAWIDRIAAMEGATPQMLRQWITAEVVYALDVAGRRRLADGSVDWIDTFSRISLEELMRMSDIHERSYLLLWLEQLLQRIVDVNTPTSAGRHVLALVEEYIQGHFAEDLHLGTVAATVYVSPYYISHLFQRELGTTFLKYLTSIRMKHAREMLLHTQLPVEVIAERVGYVSAKRFRTLFKRTFKLAPTDYRQQYVDAG